MKLKNGENVTLTPVKDDEARLMLMLTSAVTGHSFSELMEIKEEISNAVTGIANSEKYGDYAFVEMLAIIGTAFCEIQKSIEELKKLECTPEDEAKEDE